MGKYNMHIDLNVLNHLGLNLYSNTPAVLSEVVANAWDADATVVEIETDQESECITIIDNGNGMSLSEINDKFLRVGYQKRKNGENYSEKYHRPVMGRKGIGKLSLLSIAETIYIYSKKGAECNAFCLSLNDIEDAINNADGRYSPREIDFVDFSETSGTKIEIRNFKKNISRAPEHLRRRLSRRFGIIGENFMIKINNEPIRLEDRGYFQKLQFSWIIGNLAETVKQQLPSIQSTYDGQLTLSDDRSFSITGWIGTVDTPSDIQDNNKISLVVRGKLAQEDILSSFNEGGIYASYLIGEIYADYLDDDNEKDIATSSRQQIIEEDERYKVLSAYVYSVLKKIQSQWTSLRRDNATVKLLSESEAVNEWYQNLSEQNKKYAKRLFGTIETIRFDKDSDNKKELLKYGILAFERLRVSEKLHLLENEEGLEDLIKYGEIFTDLQDIEATLYWEIANERMKVIKQLSESCDENAKERVLQKYIFDNLWLLNPSWERATAGSERMEEIVKKAFDVVTDSLTEEERKGRIDIRYRTSSGKHIIIELKRYVPTYKVDIYDLHRQIDKYRDALKKCLKQIGKENEPIEAICIIGNNIIKDNMSAAEATEKLGDSGRILFYDQVINDSLESYKDYLEKHRTIGRLREIIDRI